MEIRNWKTNEVIYQAEVDTIKELVEKAVKEGVILYYADLRRADLSDADLRDANLHFADLSDADLSGASLRGANLRGANLRYANLGGADLRDANLSGTDLHFVNLSCSSLEGADLSGADLFGSNLSWVNFGDANLHYADLRDADLSGANLGRADLRGAKNVPENLPMACPTDGSFVAWKKIRDRLVKLEIPEDAKRSSATSNKCRCDKAKVLAITDLDGTNPIDEVTNFNYGVTTYRVGEMVYPDSFDDDRWNECSNGIHFFIDKISAINY